MREKMVFALEVESHSHLVKSLHSRVLLFGGIQTDREKTSFKIYQIIRGKYVKAKNAKIILVMLNLNVFQ